MKDIQQKQQYSFKLHIVPLKIYTNIKGISNVPALISDSTIG